MIRTLAAKIPAFGFDADDVTFNAYMAKRATGVFAASPIVQGRADVSGTPDVLGHVRGNLFGNPTDYTYTNFDPYQGNVALFWTPEYDHDVATGMHYLWYVSSTYYGAYDYDNDRYQLVVGSQTLTLASNAVAGTRCSLVFRWDTKGTLDSSNYACISLNDAHTYGISTAPTVAAPGATIYVGSNGTGGGSSGLIEALGYSRRLLWDGAYGTPAVFDASGAVDEIAAMNTPEDICLETGSWDWTCFMPTNSSAGVLATGIGNAWSHPHSSNLLKHWTLEDAFYGGGQWAVGFNGTSTNINCGSGVTLDDIPNGGTLTVDIWYRTDGNTGTVQALVSKGSEVAPNGWSLRLTATNYLQLTIYLATTNAVAQLDVSSSIDGKWHHATGYYDDATKTARVANDGIWGSANVGAGAYLLDAVRSLLIGRHNVYSIHWFNGAIGWLRLSDNDRHTAGTDFIPPREFPGADGNTVEAWNLNDGTGGTAVAQVTTPGNDGTITDGTWEQQWDDVLTPVYPTSLESDGAATTINYGSGANIDDLPAAAFTFEIWAMANTTGESSNAVLALKSNYSNNGWVLRLADAAGRVQVLLRNNNVWLIATTLAAVTVIDGKWHHIAVTYDDGGDKRIRIYLDGLHVATSGIGGGVYNADAAETMYIASDNGASTWDGGVGWHRMSNNKRYPDGVNFIPPDRVNPPANDANAQLLIYMADGAGTTTTDSSGNGYNGTITMGAGRWWNTPDASPGPRIFQWGYDIGSDAANDGVHQHQAGLAAGENYVARIPVRYEADKRCQPSIVAYDETNSAAISTFLGPWLTGIHDGGDGVAALADSTAPYWPYSLVSGTIHNITDGSSATITAAGNSIAATLAGGTNDDWDDDDVYLIVPPDEWVWVEPFCFELPTIDRNGAAADCIEISFRLLNSAGEGVIYWQQVELLENLLDNPSLETGAGNPWIPDGWANTGLDAGDTQASSTGGAVIHSGSDCIQWNVGATINEGAYDDGGGTPRFVSIGVWSYSTGTAGNYIGFANINQGTWQYSTTVFHRDLPTPVAWMHTPVVGRIVGGIGRIVLTALTSVGTRYLDDVYMVDLDDVSLTCTPTSKANSAETSGLRIDGTDQCTQTQYRGKNLSNILNKNSWEVEFEVTPRHDAADVAKFGASSPDVLWLWGDGNNYLYIDWSAASILRLNFNANAGGDQSGTWNPATMNAGTTYTIKLKGKRNSKMELYVDGNLRITISQPSAWGTTPSTAHWGHHYAGGLSYDATFN